VPSNAKEILDNSLSGVLMRDFSAIVAVATSVVGNMRQNGSERGSMTVSLSVTMQNGSFPWFRSNLWKNPSVARRSRRGWRRMSIVAVLIDRTPKVLLLAVDSHEEFVQMPAIAETPLPLLKTSCIVSAELPTPTSNGFVGDRDAAFARRSSTSRKLMQKEWQTHTA
jgi:hypothetical protein